MIKVTHTRTKKSPDGKTWTRFYRSPSGGEFGVTHLGAFVSANGEHMLWVVVLDVWRDAVREEIAPYLLKAAEDVLDSMLSPSYEPQRHYYSRWGLEEVHNALEAASAMRRAKAPTNSIRYLVESYHLDKRAKGETK